MNRQPDASGSRAVRILAVPSETLGARIGHSQPHTDAHSRMQPHNSEQPLTRICPSQRLLFELVAGVGFEPT
jgi:hypothetical protein